MTPVERPSVARVSQMGRFPCMQTVVGLARRLPSSWWEGYCPVCGSGQRWREGERSGGSRGESGGCGAAAAPRVGS